jgi:glycosyltransferase involved in cell wall biosynthesis
VKISVIVPTYNRPRELRLCLLSLAFQSLLPDEVLIADDGSTEETGRAIEEFATSSVCPFPVRHIWQEDCGFRKPCILNETVRNATGDYLVFIDGDCMAHRHFVRSHVTVAEPRAILGGKRVELGKKLSGGLLDNNKLLVSCTIDLLWDSINRDTRRAEESIMIANPLLRKWFKRDRITNDGIWGCNFSVPKELFYEINGCDEDFLDGSIEDNDLGIRVLNCGGKLKSVRSLAIVFHLWHKSSWSFTNEKYLHNKRIMEQRILIKEPRCVNGIDGGAESWSTNSGMKAVSSE